MYVLDQDKFEFKVLQGSNGLTCELLSHFIHSVVKLESVLTSFKMAKPILYSYYRSSCSWRVRAALEYKDISYTYKPVQLLKDGGEQHKDEYKKVNPMSQVPTLVVNGHNLIQSVSILEYIEETKPEPPLLPADPIARAKVRAIVECITSGIQPLQNLAVLQKLGEDPQKSGWAAEWITKGLHAVEDLLQQSAGQYCVADDITFADICLVPQLYNAERFKVNLAPFPIIQKLYTSLMEHPAFIKSHPANQPDCPAEQRGGL